MAQTTNQGGMFYRMKYLGGDTPAHRISGDRVRCLIEDEAYEVYLSRTIENGFPRTGCSQFICLKRAM